MHTHPSKRASWAVWLGVLSGAALLPLGGTPAGSARPAGGEEKTTPKAEPAPAEVDVDTPKAMPAQKVFKSVGTAVGTPAAPPPTVVDESGVAFGLRSSSLDERRKLVTATAFSADGKVLATAGGGLKLWDLAAGRLRASVTRPDVALLAFSPNGKALATSDEKGALYLQDPSSAEVRVALGLHGNGARALAFSPDGKQLVCAGRDGKLRWWDVGTGKPALAPLAVADDVQTLAFSRDGKTLVTSATTNPVRVWDLTTGKAGASYTAKRSGTAVALSPDGKIVATCGPQNAELWNAADGRAIGELKRDNTVPRVYAYGPAQNVLFSPDGKLLAAAHGNGGVVLWDVKTRKEVAEVGFDPVMLASPYMARPAPGYTTVATMAPVPQAVPSLAFSPDGSQLAVNKGTAALLFDVAKRAPAGRFPPQGPGPQPVLALAYSPDGKTVAAALEDRTVSVREVASGEELLRLRGHGDRVTCLAFAADGTALLTGSADRTVKVWELPGGKERLTFKGHREWVYAVALAPDGKTAASGGYDRKVILWDALTGAERATFTGHKGAVRALAFNGNGKTLASGGADRTVFLWDVLGPLEATTLKGHEGTVRALAFAPDGQTLVSTGDDGTVRVWDVAKGKERLVKKDHGSTEVVGVTFSPSGERVATVGVDRVLWVWDARTGKGRGQSLHAHQDALTAVAFAPDGRTLATGSYDNSIRFWPGVTVPVREFQGHKATVTSAALSADGSRVLSAGGTLMSGVDPKQRKLAEKADLLGLGHGGRWDNTVRLWDAATGKELLALRGHTDQVLTVAFSPNGREALSAGHDRTIRRWDLASGKTLGTLTGHQKAIRAVAFSPKGRFAVSGGDDGTVRLWDLNTGTQVRALKQHMKEVRTVAFSPDGRQIVSGDGDGVLLVWDVTGGATRPLRRGEGVASAAWTSDGRRIVCAAGQWLEVYDAKSRKRLQRIGGSNGTLERVAVLPGDTTAVTVGQDGMARFWDLNKGVEVTQFNLTPSPPAAPQPALPPGVYPAPPTAAAADEAVVDESVEPKQPPPPAAAQPLPPVPQPPPMVGKGGPVQRSFALSVSADGRRLLTVGSAYQADSTIRLWKTPRLER